MRQTGKVKLFKEDKGFGFITPDEGGADCFVHVKGVIGRQSLTPGERVEYDLELGAKGPQAVRVALLDRNASGDSDRQHAEPSGTAGWAMPGPREPIVLHEREAGRRGRDGRRHRERPRRHWADE